MSGSGASVWVCVKECVSVREGEGEREDRRKDSIFCVAQVCSLSPLLCSFLSAPSFHGLSAHLSCSCPLDSSLPSVQSDRNQANPGGGEHTDTPHQKTPFYNQHRIRPGTTATLHLVNTFGPLITNCSTASRGRHYSERGSRCPGHSP